MNKQKVLDTFIIQAESCEAMGSPFMGVLCRAFAAHLDETTAIGHLCLNWQGDPSPFADSVPLRLCGGLHALVSSGRDDALAAQYPPNTNVDWQVIYRALERHQDFLTDWMKSPPQTNEISRSSILWPALMHITGVTKMPLHLMEIGASAGLNLRLDKFRYSLGDVECGDKSSTLHLAPKWKGNALKEQRVEILTRTGCDLNPLDPLDDQDTLRLRSYVWPDQTERLERLGQAIEIAKTHPARIDQRDAVDWLEGELSELPVSGCTVIYSTIAWQYLPQAAQQKGAAIIDAAGRRSTLENPLVWLRFEADEKSPGAGIKLLLYPQNEEVELGRGDFHGRWVDWAV